MMDEMHIKEDLVFDRFIGYTDCGNVTDKLSEFERFVEEREAIGRLENCGLKVRCFILT